MKNKISFIKDSILDIQETIRAIDTKIAALLVILCVPFTMLGNISSHIEHIIKNGYKYSIVIIIIFILSWAFSLVSIIRAVSAIDNPSNHIINSSSFKGIYYGKYLFTTSILDVFFNRDVLKASKDVLTHYADFSDNETEIAKELILEQMKLIYVDLISAQM